MIRDQVSRFPVSKTFDYRTLAGRGTTINEEVLDSYFDTQLVDFIDQATTSEYSLTRGNQSSIRYKNVRRLRIRMIIALLCFTMNPKCCFFQTLLGLMCYAYGLRDRGFELLNLFSCTCSADHIREHGAYWASRRNVLDELDLS